MNVLDPRPETYAHAAAIAAMLERAQQEQHLEHEDGASSSKRDAD